ncbi:MAG: hypothetical protein RL139_96 [Gemmatimonadota bacterium]|jgi:hypothetical protein
MKRLLRWITYVVAAAFFGPAIVGLLVVNAAMFVHAPVFYVLMMTAIGCGCGAVASAVIWAFDL